MEGIADLQPSWDFSPEDVAYTPPLPEEFRQLLHTKLETRDLLPAVGIRSDQSEIVHL
jgi:hypothetical protein